MMILELLVAITFVRWGGYLTRSWEIGEKVAGWAVMLAGVAIAFAAGSRAHATPPVIYSPYVIQSVWVPAGSISDKWGFVRTTKDCAAVNDYPSERTVPGGTVLKMVINPNGHPHTDPSVWAYSPDNQYLFVAMPLGGDISSAMYLPSTCLEGVRQL